MTRHARSAPVLVLCAIVGVSACDPGLDAHRAETCRRAVPALAPTDAKPELIRVGTGAVADSIRVDYRLAGGSGTGMRPHWLLCRFGSGASLASVTTDAGPLNGASLYLLKRYFLETPDGAEADPGKR